MSEYLHPAESCIMLSSAVLDHMHEMTPAAWGVYVFIATRNTGQPVPAAVATIAAGTGLHARSIIAALKLLRTSGLIIRLSGRGSKPNAYSLPDVSPIAGRPTMACEPVSSAAEKQLTLRELVKFAYRVVTDEEFAELKETEPDQAVLYTKLTALHRNRSVPRTLSFRRFTDVIRNLAY